MGSANEEDMASRSQPSADAQTRSPEAQRSDGGRFAPRQWSERINAAPLSLEIGRTYEAWHPFKLEEYTPFPDEGPESGGRFCAPETDSTWVPGWRYEACGPDDTEEVWDGEGVQLRTVVSLHKPGHYPTRVFYVRQWRDPSGKVFGKTGLRVVVAPTFRHWLFGERWPAHSPAREGHVRWARAISAATGEPT